MHIKEMFMQNFIKAENISLRLGRSIKYDIFGKGSQISTNKKRESTVFSILFGRNLRPFPDNTVLY